ncbi:acetyltransferase [Bacillus sp. 31A1R]|uniref:Acetyltransferase n=1 Tax=Robertmurraya mangrovi TaxID=3098077 RepID=A0ABU5J1N4_9BACI|nr:acetyltransferase [Bacillus sp. 31A1R]MDZ5473304.1 acetyltransferase [Bacillus sp. 31A1R]
MKKRVIIVGAGGLARMIFSWLPAFLEGEEWDWEFAGFLDDNLKNFENGSYDKPILSTIKDYMPQELDVLIMGIANPTTKLSISKELEQRGASFMTLIHPKAMIGRNVNIGRGCVVSPGAVLTCDIEMSHFVFVNLYTTIGHDAKIGEGCTLNAHSDVTGYTELGKGVFLGSHSVVTPGMKVRDFAKIGAGSVVVREVKSETTVFGIPAKRL